MTTLYRLRDTITFWAAAVTQIERPPRENYRPFMTMFAPRPNKRELDFF